MATAPLTQNVTPVAQPATPPPPINTKTVDQAVDTVKDRLDTGWSDWAVTNDDVKDIAETFRNLDAGEAQQVVTELAKDGTLDKVAQEMSDGKVLGLGGLSASERTDFFIDMAKKLDGQGLKTLSDAFATTDSKTGGIGDVEALGQAIATHATADTKVDYVKAMAANTTDKAEYTSTHLGGSTTHVGDAEALAVGHVLASLKDNPAAAEEAFGALDDKQLNAVMAASIDETASYTRGGVSVSLDGHLAGKILDAASGIRSADLKAQIFDAGAHTLQHVNNDFGFPVAAIGKDDTANSLSEGLTKIIDSDTTGVMRELAFNQQTFDGTAFSVYAKHMLNSDQTDKLGEQMAKLQLGNGLNEDPIARFEKSVTLPTGEERHENAGAMGHFVAGVYAAANSITKDVTAQQDLTTAVLKSALTLVDKAGFTPGVSTAAAVGKEWVHLAVKTAISDPGTSAAVQLERGAMPMNPATQEIGVGDAAIGAFNDRITQVQRLAKP